MARHRLDPLSFLFGLLFVAGGLAVLGGDPARETLALGWVGPAVAIGLGGLVVAAVRPRRPTTTDSAATDNPAAPADAADPIAG